MVSGWAVKLISSKRETMELTRLSALGSIEDGRYHSSLLTTYSFDPSFMHQRVVPQLRTCGIRNVLALVDGDMLAEAMEQRIDAVQLAHPRYGLWPVYQEHGVFHPKVILCLGAAHGLLAIGSGNLTCGGHGGNDELWSVFRFTQDEQRYLPFFGTILSAMRKWTGGPGGWAGRQYEWAIQHTPWLPALDGASIQAPMQVAAGMAARMLLAPDQRAFDVIDQALKGRKVQRITVLTPFMDERGALLRVLVRMTDNPVRCVVDDRNGAVPGRLPRELVEHLVFHRWCDVQQLHEGDHACALHAKAIVFELADGAELCFQGSANASMAAMGNIRISPVNAEAGVLVERADGGFLVRLGLQLEGKSPTPYDELERSEAIEPTPAEERSAHRLLSIAFVENQFVVSCDTFIPAGTVLRLRDPEQMEENDLPLEHTNDVWIANGEFENVPTLGALCGMDGAPISNWQVVQLHELHVRNDPDARMQQIESLVDRLELGDDQLLADIVPYLPMPDPEAASRPSEQAIRTGSGDPLTGGNVAHRVVEGATPYLDWEKLGQRTTIARETSSVHRVVDVLIRSLHEAADQVDIEAEQETDERGGTESRTVRLVFEDRQPQAKKMSLSAHKARKKRLLKYLDDYVKSMERRMASLKGTGNLSKVEQVVTTDDDHAHAIILCRMLMHYLLRSTSDAERDGEGNHPGVYLQLRGDKKIDNVHDLVPLAIGSFQLLVQQAAYRQRTEWTRKRFDRYCEHLLADQLYSICNVDWPENIRHRFNLLVLNTLVLLDRTLPMQEQLAAAFERLESLRTGDRYQCRSFDPNIQKAWKVLSKGLPQWNSAIEEKIEPTLSREIKRGSYIYNSKLGICLIDAVEQYGADAAMLTLCRPGLEWNEGQGDYALKHVFRKNRVLFTDLD